MNTMAPIRREVVVAAPPQRAFDLFTASVGQWWPMATHSVFGAGATVAFENGRLVERRGEEEAEWGTVLAWEPPHLLRMTWHPGNPVEEATDLTVRFVPHEAGTRVELEHTGWERHARGEEAARGYGDGWPVVLCGFSAFVEPAQLRG
jgi:uncharacterized protein YndB with AHSA1/START domain